MKYPIVHLSSTPQLHKAFSKPIVLHFHGVCEDETRKDYMHYLLMSASNQLASQFISSQGVVVEENNQCYILCKDNLDERMMKRCANEVLSLLHERGQGNITFTFGYAMAMLDVDGHTIGILNSNKIGDPYLESEAYKKTLSMIKGDAKQHFNYILLSFEEYQMQYNNEQLGAYI